MDNLGVLSMTCDTPGQATRIAKLIGGDSVPSSPTCNIFDIPLNRAMSKTSTANKLGAYGDGWWQPYGNGHAVRINRDGSL